MIIVSNPHTLLRRPISLITIHPPRGINPRNRHLLPILIAINPPGSIHARKGHLLAIKRRRSPRPRFPPLQFQSHIHRRPRKGSKIVNTFSLLQPRRAPRAGNFKLQHQSADEDGDHISDGYDGGVEQADEQESREDDDAEDDVYGAHDRGEPVQRHGQDLR